MTTLQVSTLATDDLARALTIIAAIEGAGEAEREVELGADIGAVVAREREGDERLRFKRRREVAEPLVQFGGGIAIRGVDGRGEGEVNGRGHGWIIFS